GVAGRNCGEEACRRVGGRPIAFTRARTGLHHWADSRSIEFVRHKTDSPWRTGRRAFAASFFRHQSRWPGHLSRAGTVYGLSDYRFARMRSGFAQVFALARTIAH